MFEFLKRRKKKSFGVKTADLNNLMDFLGIDSSSDRLSEVTYFTCLKVLGEGLSKLPLALQRVSEDGGIIDLVTSPLWQTVKVRPNPYMSPSTFWAVMENNRNHWGNSYAIIERDQYSGSVKLWPVDPTCVRIELEQGKDLSEIEDITYIYTSPHSGKTTRISSEDMLHFKSSTVFAGLIGLSVREKLKISLDGAVMSQEMLNNLYKNHFVPKAAIHFDTTAMVKEDYETGYLKTLEEYAQGKGSAGGTFIPLVPGTTLIPLNIKLTDGQFLELRKYTALQIAAAFGIKPNHLNDYERSSYANSETQQLAFYTDTMLYILKQYEEELNYKLLSREQRENGCRFKFNIAAVLRGDTKSQLESLSMGVSNGVYTPNEARRNLDLPAKKGGDRIYFNGSNIAVEDAGIQYQSLPEVSEESGDEKAFLYLAKTIESAIMSLKGKDDYIQDPTTGQMMGSTGGGSSGASLGEHSKKPITEITDKAIDKVSYVAISGYSEEQCKKIQEQHKELLRFARDENSNKETAFVFRKDLSDRSEVKGTDDRLDLGGNMHGKGTDLIIMHNHPRNSSYSTTDIDFFAGNTDIKTLTIVKNNGKIETLTKGNKFDLSVFQKEYNRLYTRIVLTDTDAEKDKFVKTLLTKTRSGVIWNVG